MTVETRSPDSVLFAANLLATRRGLTQRMTGAPAKHKEHRRRYCSFLAMPPVEALMGNSKSAEIADIDRRISRATEDINYLSLRATNADGRIDEAVAQKIWDREVELQRLKDLRAALAEDERRH
jgi:hypothetical protein